MGEAEKVGGPMLCAALLDEDRGEEDEEEDDSWVDAWEARPVDGC